MLQVFCAIAFVWGEKKKSLIMLPAFCVVALAFGCAVGSPTANYYVDTILGGSFPQQIRMTKLDPLSLPNFNNEFENKIMLVKTKGSANYTSGNLTGLSKASRYSECNGPYYSFGATKINCTIGFNDIYTEFDGKVKYGQFPRVNVKARGNMTTTTIVAEFVSPPTSTFANAVNVQLHSVGTVHNVKFTNLSNMNQFLKFLKKGYEENMKAEVINIMLNRLPTALRAAASAVAMPK